MRKKSILRLSILAVFLALLWSCQSEDFTKTETNPQRNNTAFFKHRSSLSAKNATDYIRILEEYNKETDFLSGMPDQKGMPVWDKMYALETETASGLMIPLSYDDETMSSILFVSLDERNAVTGVRDYDNAILQDIVYNQKISVENREKLFFTFMFMDNRTFGNEEFIGVPKDLFIKEKYDAQYGRIKVSDFTSISEVSVQQAGKLFIGLTCFTTYHCTHHGGGACDGCSECQTTTCTPVIIGTADDPFPTNGGGGGGGSGGGGTPPIGPNVPDNPCGGGVSSAFYRPGPGCGGGTIPSNNNPCEKLKAQNSNPDFRAKVNVLETNLNEHGETGFVEKHNGSFDYKDNAASSDDSNSLSLGEPAPDMKGFLHTHVNNFEDSNGDMRIGFKIFSPADIIYFNQMVALAKQNGIPLGDIYAVMVSGSGNYQIRFTGNANQIKTVYTNTKKQYNDMYIKYFQDNNKRSDELNFLKFIDEQMYVKGIILVKMNDDGTITKKTLNSTKTQVIDSDCF